MGENENELSAAEITLEEKDMNLDAIPEEEATIPEKKQKVQKTVEKENKTFLGRTNESWAKILAFYVSFYTVIILIFVGFVSVFHNTCPVNGPYLPGRALQSPGLSFLPKLDYSTYSDWLNVNHKDVDTTAAIVYDSTNAEEYKKYVDAINKYLDDSKITLDSSFGDCQNATKFGFDVGKPCMFFKLNRVLDWEPMGVFTKDIVNFFTARSGGQVLGGDGFCAAKPEFCDGNQPRITEFLKTITVENTNMNVKTPFIRCLQYTNKGTDETEIIDEISLKYFPSSGEFSPTLTPFKGGLNKDTFKSSLVAVQFDLSKSTQNHRFYCFAFDRNIELDFKKMSSGVTSFYLKNTAI